MTIEGHPQTHRKQGGKRSCEVVALGMFAGFVGLVAVAVADWRHNAREFWGKR